MVKTNLPFLLFFCVIIPSTRSCKPFSNLIPAPVKKLIPGLDSGNDWGGSTGTGSCSSSPSSKPTKFYTEDKYECYKDGEYRLCNNVWGNGAGPESMWVVDHGTWGVKADHPAQPIGVKSYPFSERNISKPLDSLQSLTSCFSVTVPAGNANYEAAYDIWDEQKSNEIMLWFHTNGEAKPIAESYDSSGAAKITAPDQTIGGHPWDVYKGSNGANAVFTFKRKTNTNAGSVDIKHILDWIKKQGWFGNIRVGAVQFGFEITESKPGLNFTCNSFDVDYS